MVTFGRPRASYERLTCIFLDTSDRATVARCRPNTDGMRGENEASVDGELLDIAPRLDFTSAANRDTNR